ncbi:GatB/YqeY domain-containing protein [Paraglaciecola arctica]|uniref:Altered inheritance of mitochondria protein 41, mitochondrial n=1 Tax=Paraglaciecola arctica BSs20135 TaxID=493475 RepID=K6YXM3_9ALTE|nr:GatB/YqeY domain-containing protein [Paraglaciecola arctica]GAC21503.1 altered inheritance of mitochondria protein 41, mitochondrial [Paraglaciecola arctica BSs20135]
MSLLDDLKNAQKDAMRAKDKIRLGTIRMALSAVKQHEIDGRTDPDYIALDDDGVLAILIKMVKQRKDAASQYETAGRQDLLDIELAEIVILQDFMPKALSEEELDALIVQAMAESGAANMQDMGKVMGLLKPQVQGRADMGKLSGKIKAKLNS